MQGYVVKYFPIYRTQRSATKVGTIVKSPLRPFGMGRIVLIQRQPGALPYIAVEQKTCEQKIVPSSNKVFTCSAYSIRDAKFAISCNDIV